VGGRTAQTFISDIIRVSTTRRLPIFPLGGALLFPGLHLPLHVFEPRYRALVGESLVKDRMIGMVQPRPASRGDNKVKPALYDVGCMGRIVEVEAMDDGRYNIILEGMGLFRILRELDVNTAFRQVEVELDDSDRAADILSAVERASVEREARRFCDAQGYMVDWGSITSLDDQTFINGIAQVAPFDNASKQALLEAPDLQERAQLAIELMRFFGKRRPDDDASVTLQ
jgi:uncharacterized protein